MIILVYRTNGDTLRNNPNYNPPLISESVSTVWSFYTETKIVKTFPLMSLKIETENILQLSLCKHQDQDKTKLETGSVTS